MTTQAVSILVVEDSEPDVLLVREALNRAGLVFQLQLVDNGEKAIDLIEQMERDRSLPRLDTVLPCTVLPNLVLLDLNLPRMNGGQVLERLRSSPTCGQIPVVILTSSDAPKDKAEVSQFESTWYFRKPSRLEEFMRLGQVVRNLLENPGMVP